jgi:hypothetical protein
LSLTDGLTTDESRWPIVIHTTVGVPSEADVDAFIARADALLARREVHAVIFDNSNAGRVPAYMRQRSMDWVGKNREALDQYCAGNALVIRSSALRFLMATLLLVTSHNFPQETFATLDPALTWCKRQLQSASTRAG